MLILYSALEMLLTVPLTGGILKLMHTEYQAIHKTQPFYVKVVHLVPNVQTLARHDVGAIRLAPTTTLHFNQTLKTKYSVPH